MRERSSVVPKGRTLIGRGEHCDLVLRDGRVSREHALLIELPSGRFCLQDLSSENGVFINGERVREAELCHGDLIRLGKSEIHFSEALADAGDPCTAPFGPTDQGVSPTELDTGAESVPRADLVMRLRTLERCLLEQESQLAALARDFADAQRELYASSLALAPVPQVAISGDPSADAQELAFGLAPRVVVQARAAGFVHAQVSLRRHFAVEEPQAFVLDIGLPQGPTEERAIQLWNALLSWLPEERFQRLARRESFVGLGFASVGRDVSPGALVAKALEAGWLGGALSPRRAQAAVLLHAFENGAAGEGAFSSRRSSLAEAVAPFLREGEPTVLTTRARGPHQHLAVLFGGLVPDARPHHPPKGAV